MYPSVPVKIVLRAAVEPELRVLRMGEHASSENSFLFLRCHTLCRGDVIRGMDTELVGFWDGAFAPLEVCRVFSSRRFVKFVRSRLEHSRYPQGPKSLLRLSPHARLRIRGWITGFCLRVRAEGAYYLSGGCARAASRFRCFGSLRGSIV